ncbi:LLM class flavin-dependent oxidoreductase [Microbacterium immunditiarum]|uniref:Alkanesulfonate monooxygenase SsuD/methylene tetrahydromethanopterin reductase-like flavin-dependent oxidoreductase (Luciferase family) n=1 Tax=Microbacterium immunditiarum TaxID=337480 RepID=A0A7Y9GNF3_9MICO|nr:LLM class flavin-dependent oxidoreductase [Microbacterium immunditiarum]NYE19725.1 alkanesulfonate monooxygenase SsuD/methylene tetrahydromethanopterin reductase-like flavin-dependent oxidoreductase (luciferase family) [Microbacterium immunditiarum]
MTCVGAIFSPYPNPPEAFRAAVEAAEEAGVPELWIWEDCFRQSAFATASAALAWTERLRIGIGIAPMPLRNVAATAMEIASIERMFPGRLLPGVGHGVLPWMAQVGARAASPLTLMREYVPALRSLLAGEEVSVDGQYVKLDHVRLDWPPVAGPRVYCAAEGPKTLRLAGEVAGGVLLNSGYAPDALARSVETVRDGHAGAGRTDQLDVAAYVVAAFGPDAAARAAAGVDDTAPGSDPIAAVLAGTPDDVAGDIARFARAGIDDIVLLPPREESDLAAYFRNVGEVARLLG